MRIAFFATRIIYGGGEKVRNWLVKQLVNNGHEVFYLTSHNDAVYQSQLDKVGLLKMVNVVEIPFALKKTNCIKYYKLIKRFFNLNNIDLIIIFGGHLIEQLAARYAGVKILLSERCEPASRPLLSQLLKQIQYRVSDGYVFQTPEAAACYGKRATRLSVVIPNPIIDSLGDPQFENLRKEIVSVGRLSGEKNQKGIIEAFSLFIKKQPNYKLIIYGSGPLKEELNNLIKRNNLTNSVEIVSGKTNISELIKGAEMFVLNSNTEGMPNALIEAMSMGLLCISTDCPIYGPRMLIRHGFNGYLTALGNSEILANTMLEAIENNETANKIRYNATMVRVRLCESKISNEWLTYINKMFL